MMSCAESLLDGYVADADIIANYAGAQSLRHT